MAARKRTPADAGAMAAGLLVDACGPSPNNSLRMEVVRELALDLGRRLEALSGSEDTDALIEAAQACADLATLAACNFQDLREEGRPLATASVHLAAGATRALISLSESKTSSRDESHAENTRGDARSAGWRADLAVRQIEDPQD